MTSETNKQSKYLLWAFFTIVTIVMVVSFVKYFVLKNYYIHAQAECDPATEKCFVTECDPATDESCPQDPTERTSYYKFVEIKASAIPSRNPNATDLPTLICEEGDDCANIYCDNDNRGEDETCSDPVEFINNSATQELTTDDPVESSNENN